MKDCSEKFLIVGAGPVGLATAKAFKDAEIRYDQIDADGDVGGNWKHGVYRSAHIISSKHTTEYADYPMPADYPNFPSGEQMLAYLNSYADAFNLRENIEFNKKVLMIAPRADDLYEAESADGEKRIYKGVAAARRNY